MGKLFFLIFIFLVLVFGTIWLSNKSIPYKIIETSPTTAIVIINKGLTSDEVIDILGELSKYKSAYLMFDKSIQSVLKNNGPYDSFYKNSFIGVYTNVNDTTEFMWTQQEGDYQDLRGQQIKLNEQ